ncbi:MAG: cyclic nucleotide-binding domain-containing protein [Geminicoccaceae bacterium]
MRDIIAELPLHEYAAGQILLRAGTRSGKLLFLERGQIAVVRNGVQVTRVRHPGAVFGEMSLLLEGPHTADVVAVDAVACREVHDAKDFLLDHPEMMAFVAAVLAHRLDAVTRYLVDVKAQFADLGGHLGMIDEVLESVLNRQPRGLGARALG